MICCACRSQSSRSCSPTLDPSCSRSSCASATPSGTPACMWPAHGAGASSSRGCWEHLVMGAQPHRHGSRLQILQRSSPMRRAWAGHHCTLPYTMAGMGWRAPGWMDWNGQWVATGERCVSCEHACVGAHAYHMAAWRFVRWLASLPRVQGPRRAPLHVLLRSQLGRHVLRRHQHSPHTELFTSALIASRAWVFLLSCALQGGSTAVHQ